MNSSYLVVDLDQLRLNLEAVETYRDQRTPIIAVIKTDAYACGLVEIAKAMETMEDISILAVSHLSEAIAIRKAGVKKDILVLTYTDPSEIALAEHYNVIQTLVSLEYAQACAVSAQNLRVHVKVDTGLHRYGFESFEALKMLYQMDNFQFEGIFTHFASGESEDPEEIAFTHLQKERFDEVLARLTSEQIEYGMTHTQNTPSFFNYPEFKYDAIRVGMALFGMAHPAQIPLMKKLNIRPILSAYSFVGKVEEVEANETVGYLRRFKAVKPTRVAIIASGYSELIPKSVLVNGECVIGGKRYPYLNNNAMSVSYIECDEQVSMGDVVTIFSEEDYPFWEFVSHVEGGTNVYSAYLNPQLKRYYKQGEIFE